MALNDKVKEKIKEKADGDKVVRDALIKLLEGQDEGKQLKRIIEPILKTL